MFIAAYVWMTGFGNFAYYYKTSDFGLGRCVGLGRWLGWGFLLLLLWAQAGLGSSSCD